MRNCAETDLRKGIVFSSSFTGVESEPYGSSDEEKNRLVLVEAMVVGNVDCCALFSRLRISHIEFFCYHLPVMAGEI
jgi:hypothetical protein